MNSQQTITSLAESPQDDRRRRTIQYSVAMSIRLLCVILCFFADISNAGFSLAETLSAIYFSGVEHTLQIVKKKGLS